MKSESRIQQDVLINELNYLSHKRDEIDKENIESLAKFFDEYDKKIAKSIREKGLPKYILCGKNMYPLFNEYVSHLFKVITSTLINENQIILSWLENCSTAYKYTHHEV